MIEGHKKISTLNKKLTILICYDIYYLIKVKNRDKIIKEKRIKKE